MRIGLVVPGFSAGVDDWCIPALRNLVQRLAARDDVRVLALRYPYEAGGYQAFGARVTALGGEAGRGLGSARVWQEALRHLAAEHGRERFDVLHAFWANETGAVASVAGRVLGIPTVVSLAGGELVGFSDIGYGGLLAPAERLKVRLALRLADAVTAGSRYQFGLAAPWLRGRRRESVRRIPLGVDLGLFRPAVPPESDEPPHLVQVASLTPVKDQAALVRAAARLQTRGIPFMLEIAGSGPCEPPLRVLAAGLGLGASVQFLGPVPHDELPPVYRRGAVFVLTSRHEAQGMAVLEAAACGLPVVGAGVGILPELSSEMATVVPVGDPDTLADAIAEILMDPGRRFAMACAARARVAAEFGLERSVERFRELYRGLRRC